MSILEHYEIIGYEETFEVSQSKKYKNLTWFPSPNKYDSGGMLETLSEEKGLSYIGIWYLVIQLASTMPKRGVFLSDSNKPLSLKRIAMTLRIDFSLLCEAFGHFQSIGWVNNTTTLGADSERTRSELVAREDKIREDKIREENKEPLVNPLDLPKPKNEAFLASCKKGFESWWELYDKKTHKKDALIKWLKLTVPEMKKAMAVVEAYTEANPKEFRKDPHRYLAKKSFNDEIIVSKEKQGEQNFKDALKSLGYGSELNEINEQDEVIKFRKLMEEPINGVKYEIT